MASKTEKLIVQMSADLRDLKAGLKSGEGSLSQFERKAKTSAKKSQEAFANFSLKNVSTTILATATALAALTKHAVSSVDAIAKNAKAAGLAGEAYQELQHQAELSGVEAEKFRMAMGKLNAFIGQAEAGQKRQADLFRRLGLEGGTTEQVYLQLADAVRGLASDQERAEVLAKVFGEENGPKMAVAMREGAAGIEAAREEARRLGIVYSEDTLTAAEQLNDELTRQGKIISKELNSALVAIAPILVDAASGFATMARAIGTATSRMRVFLGIGSPKDIREKLQADLRSKREALLEAEADVADPRRAAMRTSSGIVPGGTEALKKRRLQLAQEVAALEARLKGPATLPPIQGPKLPGPGEAPLGAPSGRPIAEETDAQTRARLKREAEKAEAARAAAAKKAEAQRQREAEKAAEEDRRLREQFAKDRNEELVRMAEAEGRAADAAVLKRQEQAAKELEALEALKDGASQIFAELMTDSDAALEHLKRSAIMALLQVGGDMLLGASQGKSFGGVGGVAGTLVGGVLGKVLGGGGLGFASGGSFTVGGSGGTDSQLVRFMATPGEKVSVSRPGRMAMGDGLTVNNYLEVVTEPGMQVTSEKVRGGRSDEQRLRIMVRSMMQDELGRRGPMASAVAGTAGGSIPPRSGIA